MVGGLDLCCNQLNRQNGNLLDGFPPTLSTNRRKTMTRSTKPVYKYGPIKFSIQNHLIHKIIVGSLRYAKVVFDYRQREEDELNLKAGDSIIVIQSEEDKGWFKGISSGKFGLFPENFITWITEDEHRNGASAAGDKHGTAARHPLINADAVKLKLNHPQTSQKLTEHNSLKRPNIAERRQSLGNLTSPISPAMYKSDEPTDSSIESKRSIVSNAVSDITVKDTSRDEPVPVPKSPRPPSMKPKKEKTVISQAIVLFRYSAKNPDELSLVKGTKLDVIEKDEDGWWTGIDEQGNVGVFPFNFVKEVTSAPHHQPPPPVVEEEKKSLSRAETISAESKVSKRVSYYMQSTSQNDLSKETSIAPPSTGPKPNRDSDDSINTDSGKSELITPKPASSFRIALPGMGGFVKPQQDASIRSPSKNGLSELDTPEPQKSEELKPRDQNDLITFSNNSLPSSQQDLKHITKSRPSPASSQKKPAGELQQPIVLEQKHEIDSIGVEQLKSEPSVAPTTRFPDLDSLPPLTLPAYFPPGITLSAEDVYKLFQAELFKFHAEMDVRLSKEREHRLRLEKEVQDLRRLLERK